MHYGSFGYDLGINDQVVWEYSQFKLPLSTIGPLPGNLKLYSHIELVYAFVSPSYWIWNSRRMLLLLEPAFVCLGGLAIYLLARRRGLNKPLSFSILIGYLAFYGVQNAVWFDVHSISFGAAFLAWFLYSLDSKKVIKTLIFFFLAITAKENVAILTFAISLAYLRSRRDKLTVFLTLTSIAYLLFVFLVYFPHIAQIQYTYQNAAGLLSNINPLYLVNTPDKLQVIFYTLFSFGFIPLLLPLSLIPALADFFTYFVTASDLPGAQTLFLQYRITLAPLLAWASIITISRYKWLNTKYFALYILLCTMITQYTLHLPLSYLTKAWFWQEPAAVNNINTIIANYLPKDASVVAQNNIVSHISHRDAIYSLYPEVKDFPQNSPCGDPKCNWFRWHDHPQYLLVDTSPEWDARHLLENNADFIKGVKNLEKENVIKTYKHIGDTTLYKVLKNPGS